MEKTLKQQVEEQITIHLDYELEQQEYSVFEENIIDNCIEIYSNENTNIEEMKEQIKNLLLTKKVKITVELV